MCSVFKSVQQKHLEYVPDQMSEEDFWKQFFQSHYFHRDRINIAKDELFADCARQDDKSTFSTSCILCFFTSELKKSFHKYQLCYHFYWNLDVLCTLKKSSMELDSCTVHYQQLNYYYIYQ